MGNSTGMLWIYPVYFYGIGPLVRFGLLCAMVVCLSVCEYKLFWSRPTVDPPTLNIGGVRIGGSVAVGVIVRDR